MLKKISIGAMLATIAVSGDASAQQPPAITQQTATIKRTPLLQENCRKLAAETFHREPADENRVDYRAHYNIRLNKCFYEETYLSPTPVGINMWVYLSDLQQSDLRRVSHVHQHWPFLLQSSGQGMPLGSRVERACEAVYGRCGNHRDDLADFCGPGLS
jgi:hypothetical protein